MTNFTLRHLKIIPILFLFYNSFANASIRDFETTRLKSTAGAGVGSILMDESTILNPAPIAFFNVGSIYLNKGTSSATSKDTPLSETDHMGVIVSDSKGSTAGSLSYQVQKIGETKKKLMAASMSRLLKDKSAMGVSLRKTTEETPGGESTDILQTIFGVTHAINQQFTIGFIAVDPLKQNVEDSMGIFGTQYVFKDFISIMLDAGANYYKGLGETFIYKTAIQFKLLDDFYARFGYFRDLGNNEKGTGAGLGWVQPRLVLEAALKNSQDEKGGDISETSFSLSYRF
jgi:hypothetical protein